MSSENPDDIFLRKGYVPEDEFEESDENVQDALVPDSLEGTALGEILDFFQESPVVPVVKSVDMNNSDSDREYNKPKNSFIIGLNFKF